MNHMNYEFVFKRLTNKISSVKLVKQFIKRKFKLELFWNMMETQSKMLPKENNVYCFHYSFNYEKKYYVQASNEYELMFKLYKNTDVFRDGKKIRRDLLEDIINKPEETTETIETEEQIYKYLVDLHVWFYSRPGDLYYDYFEKLDTI
jgi:hypothetical protein